jgi:hypothetical protein
MKKSPFAALLFVLLFFSGACKHEPLNPDIIPCLKAKFEQFKHQPDAVAIREFMLPQGPAFWLETDAADWDGSEYILNAACDTICVRCGECYNPYDCLAGQDLVNMPTIWKK